MNATWIPDSWIPDSWIVDSWIVYSWIVDYLMNSLWQVPLLYGAAALGGRIVAPLGSRALHRLWAIALGLQVVLPGCRVDRLSALAWVVFRVFRSLHPDSSVRSMVVLLTGPAVAVDRGVALPPALIGTGVFLYLGITVYLAAQFVWRLRRTHRIGVEARPIAGTDGIEAVSGRRVAAIFADLSAALRDDKKRGYGRGKRGNSASEAFDVAISRAIYGPVTVGILIPRLLLPEGFLDAVRPAELEAVLAHEAAHMRRHDYMKNLIYRAFSLPVAYHPAVWLTRSRIAETREMVCDEMAAARLATSGQQYARILLRLATILFDPAPAVHLHAIGILDANLFERRIMNLTQLRTPARPARRIATLVACGLIALASTASALALRVHLAAASVPQAPGQFKVGGGIMAGQVLYKKVPVYPADAKANRDTIDGSVVLSAIIGKDGSVESLKVLKSLRPDYDASALEAVKDWKYAPYLLNGEQTEVETTITITYSTDHSER